MMDRVDIINYEGITKMLTPFEKPIYVTRPFLPQIGGKPIAHFGDMNMFSFHATKLYHSLEGGLLSLISSGL